MGILWDYPAGDVLALSFGIFKGALLIMIVAATAWSRLLFFKAPLNLYDS